MTSKAEALWKTKVENYIGAYSIHPQSLEGKYYFNTNECRLYHCTGGTWLTIPPAEIAELRGLIGKTQTQIVSELCKKSPFEFILRVLEQQTQE